MMEYTFYYIYSNPNDLTEFEYWINDEGGKRHFSEAKFNLLWNLKGQPEIVVESGHSEIEINDGIATINAPVQLANAKANQLSIVRQSFETALSQGYTNTDFNITLAILDKDRAKFSELLAMCSLAESLGQEIGNQSFADINGSIVELPYLQLKILLLQYGLYYKYLWDKLVTLENQIKAATIETIHSITW